MKKKEGKKGKEIYGKRQQKKKKKEKKKEVRLTHGFFDPWFFPWG